MMIVRDELWLCDDCMIAAVNGDFTGLDYHYGKDADKRQARKPLLRCGVHESSDSWCRVAEVHSRLWRDLDDDQYNLVICERGNLMPVFAIAYGEVQ